MAAELDSQPKSVQSIYTWFSENKLHVNRRYQRKLVWTTDEKQRLVESILKRYPVPAILLAEKGTGDYEIIDGLQRLHTIVSFIETSFATLDGKRFDVAQFPTAKTRSDDNAFKITAVGGEGVLSPREVSTFLDYSMAISVMRGATEPEIDDVFSRINTYGHRLSDQERRQAGVQDDFSQLVRDLACQIRGDASSNILPLGMMPSISIDLPMTKQGYDVVADEVFWVSQGILRSTDLRDSMDEQCLADIAASVVGGQIVERSKEELDNVYEDGHPENLRIDAALSAYGSERFAVELKFCIDEILKVCEEGTSKKLRDIIFTKRTSNQFPSAFAVLVIALHEALIGEKKKISDYAGVKKALEGLYDRIDTSRKSTAPEERRKNVDTIKGLIGSHLVAGSITLVYGAHSTMDIDAALRRSEIELPHYELKQGRLRLDTQRSVDPEMVAKVVKTACAMANNGKLITGTILIGITDKESDAVKIAALDGITPRKVGKRFVVGVSREAKVLGISAEDYYGQWKSAMKNSGLSEALKSALLSSMDYNDYFGLGVISISVPAQTGVSFVDDTAYWRSGDETVAATGGPKVAELAMRFA